MFSWICQKCGSEVPPSYNECPNCSEAVAPPAERVQQSPVRSAAPPPPPPVSGRPSVPPTFSKPHQAEQEVPSSRPPKPAGILFGAGGSDYSGEGIASRPIPPQTAPQDFQQGFPAPPSYPPLHGQQPSVPPPPPPASGMPSWLLMLLVALIVGGIVAGAVWLKRRSAEAPASDSAPIASESSPAAASAGHRYARFIELSGFRISEDAKRRATVRLAVTNHNAADLGDLSLTVTLKNSEGQELGTSDIKLASLEPLSSVDVTAPFKTKLRAYEVPDWQFIRAEFEITSK